MSKFKKLFPAALATVLLLQLLFIPTYAEDTTTEDTSTTTVTGKYTTADSLPAIYGAGVSVEDFENTSLSSTEATNAAKINYDNLSLSSNFSAKFQRNISNDDGQISKGSSSFQVNDGGQGGFRFYINLSDYKNEVTQNSSIAFYVKLPENSAAWKINNGGLRLAFATSNDDFATLSKEITDRTFTYYYKDGTKLGMENAEGIYPYTNAGAISTTGFEGYVSVSIADVDLSATPYLAVTVLNAKWGDSYLYQQQIYFDDFRLLNSDNFVPYAYVDYEDIDATLDPNAKYTYANTYTKKSGNSVPSYDANGIAQGKNSLKISMARGCLSTYLKVTESNATVSNLGSDYNGIAFYIDIPDWSSKYWANFKPFNVRFSSSPDNASSSNSVAPTTYVYWFEDGTVLVKYGDTGVLPYDKNGELTTAGFKGYVSVYFGDIDLTTYRFLNIDSPDYNIDGLAADVYLDDFRPCNFNVVTEALADGDAYLVGDKMVTVQQGSDTEATLSVMTNLASLGMARNDAGIAALRKALLSSATLDKHDVNKDTLKDICDLVRLNDLAYPVTE